MKNVLRLFILPGLIFTVISCGTGNHEGEMLVWSSNNSQEITFISGKINNWNVKHPERPIRFQPIPEGQSSEEIILASVVGGTTPAIYANMWQGSVEMYARAGVLVRLDTLPGFLDFIRERCTEETIQEITSEDGNIYQIPWKINPIMTLYNKTMFRDINMDTFPSTYQEYLKAARAMTTDRDGDGYYDRWIGHTSVKPIWYQRRFNFYPLYLAASDGAQLIKNNRAAFNNQHAIDVFAFLQTIYNNEYFSRQQLTGAQDPFVMQRVASLFTGPWQVSYLEKFKPDDMEYTFMPMLVPKTKEGPVYTYGDPKNIVFFTTNPDPLLSWAFLKTIIDKEGDLNLLSITGQFPRRKNISRDPYFESFLSENPKLMPFAVQADHIRGDDNHPHIVEVFDIISQEYEACVIYGKKKPEDAVRDAARAVDVLLMGLE